MPIYAHIRESWYSHCFRKVTYPVFSTCFDKVLFSMHVPNRRILNWASCPGLSLLHSFHTSWSAWGSENARNVDFWQLTFVLVTTGPLDFSAKKLNRGCMRNSLNLTSSGADDYTRTRLLRSKGVNSHYKTGQEWVDQILKTPKETPYGSV